MSTWQHDYKNSKIIVAASNGKRGGNIFIRTSDLVTPVLSDQVKRHHWFVMLV